MDEAIYRVQVWLNHTYANRPGFVEVDTDGITGWTTVKALIRALQMELGLTPDGDFGPSTMNSCPTLSETNVPNNLNIIVQGGLYCKGYSPNGFDGTYGPGTKAAIARLQKDAGLSITDGITTPVILKALLNMDAFVNVGDARIRAMQQYLNNKYFNYISTKLGIIPCDGLYSSKTNRALIYGLQVEQGSTSPDGIFGPSTMAAAPTLNVGNTKVNFTKLLQLALYVNDYKSVLFDGNYTTQMKSIVADFQRFSGLGADGIAGKQTWASLLVSTGDRNRKGTACDCVTEITPARAQALKASGYTTIGRYIVGGDWKRLKPSELPVIFGAGLKVFPIYQTSANKASYFSSTQGMNDALGAIQSAEAYGFPENTVIYFSVDFDAVDDQVTTYILPHFKAIYEKMVSFGGKYKVGIYGPRNVCSRVSNAGYASTSFVCDMSTGFSGNLGYPLPKNWAFDQISTITVGSGDGKIEIDNNIASGRDVGVSSVNPVAVDTFATQNTIFFKQMDAVFQHAMDYSSNNVYKSNQLVMQYYRHRNYDGILWDASANPVDDQFVAYVNAKIPDFTLEVLYDLATKTKMDVRHLMATANSYTVLVDNSVVAELAGWAGDLITAAGDAHGAVQHGVYPDVYTAATRIIGSDVNDSTFDRDDLFADMEAVYLANRLNTNPALHIVDELRSRFMTAISLKQRVQTFVSLKFGTLDNAQKQAEYILINDDSLPYQATRYVFKSHFKNIYQESIEYTDEEGKEIARGFKDVLASLMN